MDSVGLILDGRTPQDVPTAYTDTMKAVALTGHRAAVQKRYQRFNVQDV